ncbi:CRISPR system Cascade subunit CasC [Actinobaculum suis]|uniref:CRISPR system Cascade subunit CasC n=1 Tax=Actinobaculum suis TaxID=1657 RepID=A0A0K9ET00_9ACTO|nr:type I-E CRISPR-associated protein Cas7/Cse4/CasC [Actinobaculum suis]KMY23344.1 CRISPR-associated protein Cse4 [Actinobaculum suis]MDY5152745.1 type I-E CRISPR-associated protein Cas7/Cse4/CasC [Actinobaculum suis]OCA95039.1 type I-E CRISPR-associated protein Cas7/Cse4/CasC [Actinobaculum suis]OCA95751.1 type I-E CRISPR-associated protein Cas7/Cse4/CasC [Actinobaculum suis]SDE08243.1 CRISPR system Cascade subunit CasC [Actinobaculum suis]
MARHLTIHQITNVPYSNLNRDDSGTPKRVTLGGALRALHSSQSIKRGIRTKYEEASLNTSVRSGNILDEVMATVAKLAPEADIPALRKIANKRIGELTKSSSAESESDRSVWVSQEEINTLAEALIHPDSAEDGTDFISGNATGSLAIAAFGRMFANSPQHNTEAAIAVSPGITTHAATIETDYFTTVDDIKERAGETGATYLGVARFVNGTFYRSVTIDREQLKESWTGYEMPENRENLSELIRAIVYGAPRGKENATAPYTMPSLLLAEEQRYRTAYSFEKPVEAGRDGGYEETSIAELNRQYKQARSFDPGNFGPLELVSGTAELDEGEFAGATSCNLDDFIAGIVDWILEPLKDAGNEE